MDVVAARVHHPDVLTEMRRAHFRREREVGFLGDGQGVHVRANGDDRSGAAAFQERDYAVSGNSRLDLQAERFEVSGHERGGLLLTIRQLRVLVDLMPDLDDARENLGRLLLHAGERLLRVQQRRRRQQRGSQADPGQFHGALV